MAVWALAYTVRQVCSWMGQEVLLEYQPSSPNRWVGLRCMRCVGWTFGMASGPAPGSSRQRAWAVCRKAT